MIICNVTDERALDEIGYHYPITTGEWRPGARKLSADEQELFEEFAVEHLANYIKQSIDLQRYEHFWEELSERWLEAKIRKGWKLGKWQATNFLRNSISYWYSYDRHAWSVGIKEDVHYPDDGPQVLLVARVLEFGSLSRNIPARPLFTRALSYWKRHISGVEEKFVQQAVEGEFGDDLILVVL